MKDGKHTYPKECKDIINHIQNGKENVFIDKWYKHKSGFIWKLNSKNYYHIWKFEKIETNAGVFKGMVHYRLTDKNTLAEIEYKILETKEAAIEFYNSFNAE